MRYLQEFSRKFAYINWAIADQVMVSGTNFATTVLVARFLGIEEFGRFALAWLAVFFAQNVQIALVISPMMTIGAKQSTDDHASYSGAVVVQQFLFAIITTGIVIAGITVADMARSDWGLGQVMVPLATLVFIGQLTEFLRRYYFTFNKARISFLVDAVRYGSQLLMLCALFLVVGTSLNISKVFQILAASAFLGLCAGAFCFGPFRLDWMSIRRVAERHWRFSRWIMPSAIATWCRENFIHTAVAAVLGLTELGALRAAQQLVHMVNILIQSFDNIVPMRAGRAYSGHGFAGLVDFIDGFVLRYSAAIACLLLAIGLFGEQLMLLVYGPGYDAYGSFVAAYAAVMVLYLVRNLLAIMVRAMETTVFEFYSSILGAVFITVCSAPLVSNVGMAGAFIAMAVFESIMIFSLSFSLQSKRILSM